jgi:hypothetical protein
LSGFSKDTVPTMGWYAMELAGVDEVIERAARKVANNSKYGHAVELEDLAQEARILVATKTDLQAVLAKPGILHHRLVQDLVDLVKTDAGRRDKTVSLDELNEGRPE